MSRTKIRGDQQVIDESITGTQILDSSITGDDIRDHSISITDINTSTGGALITSVLTSTGLVQTYTGSAEGTGTVTIAIDQEVVGLTTTEHRILDQLVHEIVEDNYCEVSLTKGRISSIISYTDSGKLTKIREVVYTRSDNRISQIDIIQYDSDGDAIVGEHYTGVITRSAGRVQSVNWTLS